jgi:hypothetical protein
MNICKSLSLLFLICMACGNPLPTLEGIDKVRWEEDKNGCGNVRRAMRESIDSQKEKLLGLDQLQIVELLGRPDQNELSERSQKFFYYYIERGPSCPDATDTLAARLAIRFNAMGLAKEVAAVRGKW